MKAEHIEDIYELSPVQHGLLFHSLYAPRGGVFVGQLSCLLQGHLALEALKQSWQQLVEYYPVLRTSFHWKELDKPLQVVHKHVTGDLLQQDWRSLSPEEQSARMGQFLYEDRISGFDLTRAPAMRLTLIRLNDDSYRFIWTYHHILLDGWSIALLLKDVFAAYEAAISHQFYRIPAGRPYRDYILWQQGQDILQAEKYWKQALYGFTASSSLTGELVHRQAVDDESQTELQQMQLQPLTTTGLQALARQHQLTLGTLLQGAWALVLARYSNEQDILFGVTSSGRSGGLAGIERMVGLFINTLPVRVRIAPDVRLLDWLKALQEQQVERQQYEYSSLVQVQGWSDIPRDRSLFESIVVIENYPFDLSLSERGGDIAVTDVQWVSKTIYPLTLVAIPGPPLIIQLAYKVSYFGTDVIAGMLAYLQTLLEAIAVAPEQRLADLPSLSARDSLKLLVEWNPPPCHRPTACIHEVFERQVVQFSDVAALNFEEHTLTYQVLNQRANQLAHYLQRLGVTKESLIGLHVERSIELVIGVLGILKAGGAYVPLDPAYPAERLNFIRADASVQVLVTQQHLLESWSSSEMQIVCLERAWSMILLEENDNIASSVIPENLAYVIYTSGSTGKPKGVLVPHEGLCNLTQATRAQFQIHPHSHVLQYASPSFDASVWQIFMALHAGATLYLINQRTTASIPALVQLLNEKAITVTDTPSILLEILPAEEVKTLQTLSTGGDRCNMESARAWLRGRRFFNVYGPTETTVITTWHQAKQVPEDAITIPIGRPIPNAQIYLLDAQLQPVPLGVSGELYVGGVGVTRGYLNRPDLTAERFIPHPFSSDPGRRLYRTGDQARYLEDGCIEFLGRNDAQVKLRGFRIELGEIESVLRQHPCVGECAVLLQEDRLMGKYLVAYIEAAIRGEYEETLVNGDHLQEYLEEKLPDYMIPSFFMMMDSLPRLPNRKLNRAALPVPQRDQWRSATYVAPRTAVEEALTAVWSQVLGVEQIGIHDNFFTFGGHSLLATQIVSHLQRIFQIDMPIRWLFDAPTIARFAPLLIEESESEQDCQAAAQLWLEQQKAEQLLARLEELSDIEVEQALQTLLLEEEDVL